MEDRKAAARESFKRWYESDKGKAYYARLKAKNEQKNPTEPTANTEASAAPPAQG